MLSALFVGLCGAGAFGAIWLLASRGRGGAAGRAAYPGVAAALALVFALAVAPVAFLDLVGPGHGILFPSAMVALLFAGGLLALVVDGSNRTH